MGTTGERVRGSDALTHSCTHSPLPLSLTHSAQRVSRAVSCGPGGLGKYLLFIHLDNFSFW